MKRVRTLLAASIAGLCLAAAAPAPPTPAYTDITEVTAVEIPVQVMLDGKPVRGLKAEDFVVYQEKSKQEITGFDVVDLYGAPSAPAAAPADVPAPARRHFLFLFDLSFSEPKAIVQARQAAKDLMADLHPSDLVAVATYAASRGPELVLGFTPDREQARAAVDTLGLPELVDRNQTDPLRIVVESLRQDMAQASGGTDAGSAEKGAQFRAGNQEMLLDRLEGYLVDSQRASLEADKDKVTALTRSFTDLARLMRSVSGRKHVVYLSEGYDSSILTGSTDANVQKDHREATNEGEIWKVDSEARFGSAAAAAQVDAMLQELRRADCVVQAVDIGGLRATQGSSGGLGYERKNGRESLFQMARDTGGDLYENFNDLGAAMGKMLERTGVTYVLTIQPPVAPDGTYHDLRVELKHGPRGARVVHRPGYYAPRPFAQRSRYEKMLATAGDVLLGEEGGTVRVSALAAPVSNGGATADVLTRIEIDGPSLLHLNEGEDVPVEIYIYAMDSKGRVRDFVAQTLSLDLFKLETRLLESGLRFYGHLELPPGTYTARVLVRNGRTGLHGLKVVPLQVPSTATADLPAVFRPQAEGSWLVVREAPRPGRREISFP
ncbi:MAG TPA: VWA domain-containing protein [Thermoanaerobaculia bacterium]|jgi:VWFA-related protein|nr:VWA domain-containing protein [Thermoanaerobaculia bacterium]